VINNVQTHLKNTPGKVHWLTYRPCPDLRLVAAGKRYERNAHRNSGWRPSTAHKVHR